MSKLWQVKDPVQFLIRLLVVEMWVRTCLEEASRSVEPSGCSTYGCPHAVWTTEAGAWKKLHRCMLVDLILRKT
eukprot:7726392-Ditylum_brightwellii.AAC.1